MTTRIPSRLEDCPSWVLPTPLRLTLQGASKAGQQTGFKILEWGINLDAGIEQRSSSNSIFISHSHVDHSWNFPLCTCSRFKVPKGCQKLSGTPLYAPKSAIPLLDKLQETCLDLAKGRITGMSSEAIQNKQNYHPFGVSAGELYDLPALPKVKLEVLPAYHPAESVGFGFSTTTNKLKKEYRGMKGKEIKALRDEGVEITHQVITPQFIFYGDTSIRALEDHEEWTKYPVIIIEATNYPMQKNKLSPEEVRAREHIHFQDLFLFIKKHPEIFFVVIHSTMMVNDHELLKFEEMIQEVHGITNFRLWNIEDLRSKK